MGATIPEGAGIYWNLKELKEPNNKALHEKYEGLLLNLSKVIRNAAMNGPQEFYFLIFYLTEALAAGYDIMKQKHEDDREGGLET